MNKLDGKIAVVTGASKGIGASIAKHLAAEGAAVVVNYASNKEAADRVVDEIIGAGGKAIAVQADVTKKVEVEGLFVKMEQTFGKLDILVNNAGIYECLPLEDITEEHFHKQFDLNVLGLILTSQQAVKYFGSEGGSIINISSIASTAAPATGSVYNATKAAVDAVTKSLAKELGSRQIRVNSINPGMVKTEGLQALGVLESDFRKQIEAQTPLGRIGQVQDIAPAAVREYQPDVTLMDLRMPQMAGFETISAICAEFKAARIVVLTTYDGDEDIYRGLQAGAKEYLLKDAKPNELLSICSCTKVQI